MIAMMNEIVVTIKVGKTISVGLLAPVPTKIAITVAGIIWNPAVFIAKNIHILFKSNTEHRLYIKW